jgi:hypothetical protein
MENGKPSTPALLWRALWIWGASATILLAINWFSRISRGGAGVNNLTWFIICLIFLPWHSMLAVGLAGKYPRRIHASWIAPLLVIIFALGCWLMMVAYFADFHRILQDAFDIKSGAGREIFWITLLTLPGAMVPIAFYLFWPRIPKKVAAAICSACGYDLRGSMASARCPECGKFIEMGVDFPYPEGHASAGGGS